MTEGWDHASTPPVPPGGCLLGLDVGGRRLGVALLEPRAALATPLRVIERGKGKDDWGELARLVKMHQTVGFVVGLPLLPSGGEGEQAHATRQYVKELRRRYPKSWIAFADERYTSAEAEDGLHELGMTAAERKKGHDARAAVLILKQYSEHGALEIIP